MNLMQLYKRFKPCLTIPASIPLSISFQSSHVQQKDLFQLFLLHFQGLMTQTKLDLLSGLQMAHLNNFSK
jgi:hypothetical protein